MFRRDPLRPVLRQVGEFLGHPAPDPAETDGTTLALARAALAHGGVIGVARGGRHQLFSVGTVPQSGVFELASLTKPFTAALAASLVQSGSMEWTTPLHRLGRPLRGLPMHFTALSLATHTAGVPAHPARAGLTTFTHFYDPYGAMTPRAVLDSARRWATRPVQGRPTNPPKVVYSNLGAGVLALALAHVAGQELSARGYLHALEERVLGPLLLPDVTAQPHPARLVAPRGVLGGESVTGFGALLGAGGLYGTAADLLTFAGAHLSGQAGTHWRHALHPAGLVPPASAVAPGWFYSASAIPASTEPVVWHDGVARGTRAALGFHPGSGRVVVVLARGGVPVLGLRAAVPLLMLRLLGAGAET